MINRFFIIGNPRSGTTLLRLMLNRHPMMVVPPEAGFLVWLHKEFGERFEVNQFINRLRTTKKIENWKLDFEELTEILMEKNPGSYSELMDAVYIYYYNCVLNRRNVKQVGDKNNYYLNHINLLNELYPEAKYIHIIRDGRSVAVSYKNIMKKKIDNKHAPRLATDMREIAAEWRSNVLKVEKSFSEIKKDLCTTVRFEDLVNDPGDVLKNICSFLGISFAREMLGYYQTQAADGLEPPAYFNWKEKNTLPIIKEEANRYQELSNNEIYEFEKINGSLLERLGYKCIS